MTSALRNFCLIASSLLPHARSRIMSAVLRQGNIALLFAGLLLSACGRPDASTRPPRDIRPGVAAPAANASSATSGMASPAVVPLAAELTSLDDAGLRALIDQQQGQVVLVDFWATWCGPCKEGFTDLQAWRERYAQQGLRIVAVSLDDAADPETRTAVREFLAQRGAGLLQYVSRWGGEDRSFDAFEIDHSALPHLQLFDRQGQRIRKFVSGDPQAPPFTHDDVEQAIRAALSQGPQGSEPHPPAAPQPSVVTPGAPP